MSQISTPANAPQTPAAIQTVVDYLPSPVEAELLHLSQQWMDAIRPLDEKRLREILAPDFTLQIWDATRARQSIESWMHMATNRLKVASFAYSGLNAQVFDDTALVFSRFAWSGHVDGNPFSDHGFMTDFWQKRDGKWRVVARRSAPIQQIQLLTDAPVPTVA